MKLLHNLLGPGVEHQLVTAGAGSIDVALTALDQVQHVDGGLGKALMKQHLLSDCARTCSLLLRLCAHAIEVVQEVKRSHG